MHQELKAAKVLAESLPAEELPALIGELAEINAVALQRLTTREVKPQTEWLDVAEVAARTGMSVNYIYRHSKKFGGRKEGGALRFSSAAFENYLRRPR